MKELREKVAVITGAASGFGREFAIRCADEGMKVVLTDIDEGGLAATVALLRPGTQSLTVRSDVSKADSIEHVATSAYGRFGACHLLFNNAGVGTAGPIWMATLDDWKWTFGQRDGRGSRATQLRPTYAGTERGVAYRQHGLRGRPAGPRGLRCLRREQACRRGHQRMPLRQAIKSGKLNAADIAEVTIEAVKNDRFYILPHPNVKIAVEIRMKDILLDRAPTNTSPR